MLIMIDEKQNIKMAIMQNPRDEWAHNKEEA